MEKEAKHMQNMYTDACTHTNTNIIMSIIDIFRVKFCSIFKLFLHDEYSECVSSKHEFSLI